MSPELPDAASLAAQPVQRPSPPRLLWYCLGGSLPARNSTWVLNDVTGRTWLLRHFARTMLYIVPLFTLYMLLMPSSLTIRLLTGLTFAGGVFMFSLVNTLVDTDRRAVRAGYTQGAAAKLRGERSEKRQRDAAYLRRERIAERRARRR